MKVPDSISKCVVFLQEPGAGGPAYLGTAFCASIEAGEHRRLFTYLVTARHARQLHMPSLLRCNPSFTTVDRDFSEHIKETFKYKSTSDIGDLRLPLRRLCWTLADKSGDVPDGGRKVKFTLVVQPDDLCVVPRYAKFLELSVLATKNACFN